MKIKFILLLVLFASCGTSHKSSCIVSDVNRSTQLNGIGSKREQEKLAESLNILEVELFYSRPDTTGEQHIEKVVRRAIGKDMERQIEIKDSIYIEEEKHEDSKIVEEEEKIYENFAAAKWFVLIVLVLLIIKRIK